MSNYIIARNNELWSDNEQMIVTGCEKYDYVVED